MAAAATITTNKNNSNNNTNNNNNNRAEDKIQQFAPRATIKGTVRQTCSEQDEGLLAKRLFQPFQTRKTAAEKKRDRALDTTGMYILRGRKFGQPMNEPDRRTQRHLTFMRYTGGFGSFSVTALRPTTWYWRMATICVGGARERACRVGGKSMEVGCRRSRQREDMRDENKRFCVHRLGENRGGVP